MNHPIIRGLTAVVVVSLIMVAIWWLWMGRKGPNWWGELPTASIDRLEKNGVPDFSLPKLNGEAFRLSDLHDKLIIVNFWASWCEPCVKEFPSMLKLVDHYQGKLELVAISADEDKNEMLKFVRAFEGERPGVDLLWDPSMKVAKEFGTNKLPESYIIDSHRQLIRKVVGTENWYNQNVIDFMDDKLGDF